MDVDGNEFSAMATGAIPSKFDAKRRARRYFCIISLEGRWEGISLERSIVLQLETSLQSWCGKRIEPTKAKIKLDPVPLKQVNPRLSGLR